MEKIINGKRYDTNRAHLIGSDVGKDLTSALYRKQGGEYFLFIVSPYYDAAIKPIGDNDARQWVNDHMGADVAEKLFTVNADDSKRRRLQLEVDAVLYDLLSKAARSDGQTISRYVREAIIDRMQRSGILGVDELS